MNVRRKSLHRSHNGKLWKKRANQRAAKERKRVERATYVQTDEFSDALNAEAQAWLATQPKTKLRPTGFTVTIRCREDGESVSFSTSRGPFGFTVPVTTCLKRIACVMRGYKPLKA